ncbi:MAG: hypothetical protein NTX16_14605 [Actinobacteria bacterium]|nr:hypothetical protein [Actinomycetota bacterium]
MSARGAAAAGSVGAAVSHHREVAYALMNVVQTPMLFPGGSFLPPLT